MLYNIKKSSTPFMYLRITYRNTNNMSPQFKKLYCQYIEKESPLSILESSEMNSTTYLTKSYGIP